MTTSQRVLTADEYDEAGDYVFSDDYVTTVIVADGDGMAETFGFGGVGLGR